MAFVLKWPFWSDSSRSSVMIVTGRDRPKVDVRGVGRTEIQQARAACVSGQDVKIYLVICFSVAFVTTAAISLVGADRVPDWVLPSLVFGVPIIAIIVVLALGRVRRRRNQEERLSAKQ